MKKLLVLALFILTNITAGAAEYEFLRTSGITPLAGLVSKDSTESTRVFLQSIDNEGNVSFVSRKYVHSGYAENTIGRIKVGQTLIYRTTDNHPAVRIKVTEVNLENGTATLEISTFWPQPNK